MIAIKPHIRGVFCLWEDGQFIFKCSKTISYRVYYLHLERILNINSTRSHNQNLVESTIYRRIKIDHIICGNLTLGYKDLI